MSPEVWVGLAVLFVSGGAIGSAGTLLAQWVIRKVQDEPLPRSSLGSAETDLLQAEVADMSRHLRNLDARLDFTEQLLGGALPTGPAPKRLEDTRSTRDADEKLP